MSHLTGKEVLITGGTGSLGKELIRQLLADHVPKGIRVFSRDELKQWQMRATMPAGAPVAFLVGDVRDPHRLRRAMKGVNVVIHAAALKQIGSCEDNPLEAIKTNVHGAENVLNAAIDCGVERVMNVSTDKAVKPVNLYGATKMAAERLFTAGNVYTGGHVTRFSCCRYGNVLGSRGSVAHVFAAQAKAGQPITITHTAMTRFWVSLPAVARFLLDRIGDMVGGEVFVPKMKSMGVYQMACAMAGWDWNAETFKNRKDSFTVTGIRQGEKLHESLFCDEEYVGELPGHYVVTPNFTPGMSQGRWELRSDRNPNGWLTAGELVAMLGESGL